MTQPLNETAQLLHNIAEGLDKILNGEDQPRRYAFTLMVAPVDEKPNRMNVNYIANIPRPAAKSMLKAVIARWDTGKQWRTPLGTWHE